ncbi:MAG: ribosomal protein S18-alanine N-acetyltransferase [Thermosphaera aggregans]|jgi:ribosomal-protein-alanine N-acetyltransferase|uniref:ribosomal protein S18-alanine N-acetyltransferase n=1 Tax=Thermosphaera aggregans TaxID=54254 RepID=UPI003C00AFB6
MIFIKEKPVVPAVNTIFENALAVLGKEAQGYTIRPARTEDLDSVIRINREALPENYPRAFFEDLFNSYGKSFFVAEAPGGEVVGYVMCRVEYKPGFFKTLLVKSGHIVSIAVLKEHRDRGLGLGLMAHALKSLYENYRCSETYLEVRVSNTPAINLYEKLGYVKIRVEKQYYLDGEDAYIMARPLP